MRHKPKITAQAKQLLRKGVWIGLTPNLGLLITVLFVNQGKGEVMDSGRLRHFIRVGVLITNVKRLIFSCWQKGARGSF